MAYRSHGILREERRGGRVAATRTPCPRRSQRGSLAPEEARAEGRAASRLRAVAVIGASGNELAALETLLSEVPSDAGAAYIVVVDTPPVAGLADRLRPRVQVVVDEVRETTALLPNRIYILSPSKKLEGIDHGHLRLSPRDGPGQRVSIDLALCSTAESYGVRAVGVVLAETGEAGDRGLWRIEAAGGLAIREEFWPPPRGVTSGEHLPPMTGLILPLSAMPDAIRRRADTFLVAADEVADEALGRDTARPPLSGGSTERTDVEKTRRALPRGDRFFRDPLIFEALERNTLPRLFAGRAPEETVRVWCVGCARGEEAYSLAMLLAEAADRSEASPDIRVFATDADEPSIAWARAGWWYPRAAAEAVRKDRSRRFLRAQEVGYRVARALRESVVFAQHDLLSDPPYSHLDLILC